MSLLDRHLALVAALRRAGLAVSLAEDLDAIAALGAVGWGNRDRVRELYAATLVKTASARPTFDELFDLYFPVRVGTEPEPGQVPAVPVARPAVGPTEMPTGTPEQVASPFDRFRGELVAALAADDRAAVERMAVTAVGQFGAIPARSVGQNRWSAYSTMRRVNPEQIQRQLIAALTASGLPESRAGQAAATRVGAFTRRVEAEALRRVAEEKGADAIAQVTVRPTIEKLDLLHAHAKDVELLRRALYPLARKLAAKMTRTSRAKRGGALDLRRTIRESMSYGGVRITTRHKPKRPHRSDLVVLCDVSGSVAHFATFTLMLMVALREQFSGVRAFMFVDSVVEVTDVMRPGADLADTMSELTRAASYAATVGRTNYGRTFQLFAEQFPDALGPKSSLLILGDARSNHADLHVEALQGLVDHCRHAWWLNPEAEIQWDVGDSAVTPYAAVVPMVECRNLDQLGEFIRRLA